jgi:hypothetical protein
LTHVVKQTAQAGGSDVIPNQGYTLNRFPENKADRMDSAVASARTNVVMCDYLTWLGELQVLGVFDRIRFEYEPNLGLCGRTFPGSWYIQIGESAFDPNTCCYLSSTLAHEASHVDVRTESAARSLECHCFGCSCK